MTTFIRVTVNKIRAGIEINLGRDPDGVVENRPNKREKENLEEQ